MTEVHIHTYPVPDSPQERNRLLRSINAALSHKVLDRSTQAEVATKLESLWRQISKLSSTKKKEFRLVDLLHRGNLCRVLLKASLRTDTVGKQIKRMLQDSSVDTLFHFLTGGRVDLRDVRGEDDLRELISILDRNDPWRIAQMVIILRNSTPSSIKNKYFELFGTLLSKKNSIRFSEFFQFGEQKAVLFLMNYYRALPEKKKRFYQMLKSAAVQGYLGKKHEKTQEQLEFVFNKMSEIKTRFIEYLRVQTDSDSQNIVNQLEPRTERVIGKATSTPTMSISQR